MSPSKMSPTALSRCRKLLVTISVLPKKEVRWLLEVIDQRFNNKVVTSFSARTEIDYQRVRRTYVQRYRIPQENVEVIEVTPDTPEIEKETTDVVSSHRRTPKIHEPRKAVLVFKTPQTLG